MGELEKIEKVLLTGDLSCLSSGEKIIYYRSVCDSLGLNPLTKPFEYMTLKGKEVLYARRDCTEQLRKIHSVSLEITSRGVDRDCYVVTTKATDKTGRTDESTGSVSILNLKGEDFSNAIMKAETKAKRRVTLSICGLGSLDETEIMSIPEMRSVPLNHIGHDKNEDEYSIGHIAAEVRCLISEGKEKEAYSLCEQITDVSKKSMLWHALDATERNILKKIKEDA